MFTQSNTVATGGQSLAMRLTCDLLEVRTELEISEVQEQRLREVNRALYNDVHEVRDDAFNLRSRLLEFEKNGDRSQEKKRAARDAQEVEVLRAEVERLQEQLLEGAGEAQEAQAVRSSQKPMKPMSLWAKTMSTTRKTTSRHLERKMSGPLPVPAPSLLSRHTSKESANTDGDLDRSIDASPMAGEVVDFESDGFTLRTELEEVCLAMARGRSEHEELQQRFLEELAERDSRLKALRARLDHASSPSVGGKNSVTPASDELEELQQDLEDMERALKTSELQRNASREGLVKARSELLAAVTKASTSELKLEHAEAELRDSQSELRSIPVSPVSRSISRTFSFRHSRNVSRGSAFGSEELRYLPKEVNGIMVLVKEEGWSWRATNEFLGSTATGLAYRKTKDINDKVDDVIPWGAVRNGDDEGDGWVSVEASPEVVREEDELHDLRMELAAESLACGGALQELTGEQSACRDLQAAAGVAEAAQPRNPDHLDLHAACGDSLAVVRAELEQHKLELVAEHRTQQMAFEELADEQSMLRELKALANESPASESLLGHAETVAHQTTHQASIALKVSCEALAATRAELGQHKLELVAENCARQIALNELADEQSMLRELKAVAKESSASESLLVHAETEAHQIAQQASIDLKASREALVASRAELEQHKLELVAEHRVQQTALKELSEEQSMLRGLRALATESSASESLLVHAENAAHQTAEQASIDLTVSREALSATRAELEQHKLELVSECRAQQMAVKELADEQAMLREWKGLSNGSSASDVGQMHEEMVAGGVCPPSSSSMHGLEEHHMEMVELLQAVDRASSSEAMLAHAETCAQELAAQAKMELDRSLEAAKVTGMELEQHQQELVAECDAHRKALKELADERSARRDLLAEGDKAASSGALLATGETVAQTNGREANALIDVDATQRALEQHMELLISEHRAYQSVSSELADEQSAFRELQASLNEGTATASESAQERESQVHGDAESSLQKHADLDAKLAATNLTNADLDEMRAANNAINAELYQQQKDLLAEQDAHGKVLQELSEERAASRCEAEAASSFKETDRATADDNASCTALQAEIASEREERCTLTDSHLAELEQERSAHRETLEALEIGKRDAEEMWGLLEKMKNELESKDVIITDLRQLTSQNHTSDAPDAMVKTNSGNSGGGLAPGNRNSGVSAMGATLKGDMTKFGSKLKKMDVGKLGRKMDVSKLGGKFSLQSMGAKLSGHAPDAAAAVAPPDAALQVDLGSDTATAAQPEDTPLNTTLSNTI